jgi:hypothetical protein
MKIVICLQIPTTFLNWWKNYFSHLLNVHSVRDVRQREIHTDEPPVPGPSHLEFEVVIAKLKKYKSSGSDQIPAEMIQAGRETVSVIHLINSIWNKEELLNQWKESTVVLIYTKDDKKAWNNYHGISLLSTSCRILSNIFLSMLRTYIN